MTTLGNKETNVTPEPVVIVKLCATVPAKEFGETRVFPLVFALVLALVFALKFKTPLFATEQRSSPFLTCLGFRV